jgi:hypothetical protein
MRLCQRQQCKDQVRREENAEARTWLTRGREGSPRGDEEETRWKMPQACTLRVSRCWAACLRRLFFFCGRRALVFQRCAPGVSVCQHCAHFKYPQRRVPAISPPLFLLVGVSSFLLPSPEPPARHIYNLFPLFHDLWSNRTVVSSEPPILCAKGYRDRS